MERSIGMLIFQAICYSEEAAGPPPLFSVTQSLRSLLSENLRLVVTCCSFCMKASSLNSQITDILSFTLCFIKGFWHFDLLNKDKLVFVALAGSRKTKTTYFIRRIISSSLCSELFLFCQHCSQMLWLCSIFVTADEKLVCLPLQGQGTRALWQVVKID